MTFSRRSRLQLVAAVAVPQAMAYALIVGLPAEYGLYTAIVMTAVFYVLGLLVRMPGSFFGLVTTILTTTVIHGPAHTLSEWQEPIAAPSARTIEPEMPAVPV